MLGARPSSSCVLVSMEPAAMSSIRKTLRIHDAWLIISWRLRSLERYVFAMLDPFSGCTLKICPPPQLCTHSSFLEFDVCGVTGHEVLISVKPKPDASLKAREQQGLYSFDGACMKWNDAKYSSLPSGRVSAICATDIEGGYLYVEGQFAVQRLDLKTKLWEVLPDPHVKRALFPGVMLQNRFCIVGGRGQDWHACASGEIWDPIDRTWTLVPELWSCEIFKSWYPLWRVAVVMDQLYALRMRALSVELMYYATSSKVWICLGDVPVFDDCHLNSNLLALIAMDQELWVLAFNCLRIWRTKPYLSKPLSWSILSNARHKAGRLASYVGAMLV